MGRESDRAEKQVYRAGRLQPLTGLAKTKRAEKLSEMISAARINGRKSGGSRTRHTSAEHAVQDSGREERRPDGSLFAEIAEAIDAVSTAEWARDCGYTLYDVPGGFCCKELPDISFYDDGTWSNAASAECGGALEFSVHVRKQSLEESIVSILKQYNPALLQMLRSRPSARTQPEIERMKPDERILMIKAGLSPETLKDVKSRNASGRLKATRETAQAAAAGRDER